MKKRTPSLLSLTAATALLAGLAGAPPAAAGYRGHHPSPQPPVAGEVTTVATGLITPLRIALGSGRSVDVAQSIAGSVVRVGQGGGLTTLDPGIKDYAADAVSRSRGTTYYTLTTGEGLGVPENNVALLRSVDRRGNIRTITDLAEYERRANPDQVNTYGFRDLDAECLAQIDPMIPNGYTGVQDSHPYDTMRIRGGILVADAGANAILKVSERSGETSTVAVLPPAASPITAQSATENRLPACTVGHEYFAEPVPTDMAMGRDGRLYVATLPGGPGGPGSIYTVNLRTGAVELAATGLVTPTGIAVSARGDIYVAELFANRISVIPRGTTTAQPFLEVVAPADVELRGSALYASTDAIPPGGFPEPGEPTDPNAPPPVFDGKVIRIQLTSGGDPRGLAEPDGAPAEPNND
ncbi:ScyD/ScyE family protein [Arthrobacter caoxuetaonis]|uniref:ScyD/ScyE family protein n=1 Tax=Arthrobacter caoxuetaonis TaxID=2886935 RepID=UPI001D146086|nr:ScyD/ScyE family protein [Arthrobacter caoxuetaonis]MCC3283937.1 ScyD/ScyE family protein [Arthrobacter caoxuetaonis]